MRTISVENLAKTLLRGLIIAQRKGVVITRNGKPAAVLVGVEGKDWETVVLETSPCFWNLIEERRKQATIPLAELRKRLEGAGRCAKVTRPPAGSRGSRITSP